MSVSVNGPKTPVHKGSNGIAAATIPNVCKMPGPPAPFIPVPLPNIGKSGDSPKGYSKKVKVEGKPVAIKGATFKSMGDVASKGTGGGLISANTHGPTKFVGPGSMDVKFEGKNVQLLTDPMLNNCGPSGSPPNAATLMGVIQMTGMVTAIESSDVCPLCDEAPHDPLEETEETKADAGSLASNFDAELNALPKKVYKPPTMLGVVYCKCGKKYADQSAMTTKQLCDAASKSGMKHPEGVTVSYADGSEALDAAYEEKMPKVKAGLAASTGNAAAVDESWSEAEDLAEDSFKNRDTAPAAYPPGTCAAQGAMLLAHEDKGLPTALTEQWHHPKGKKTAATVEYIDDREGKREVKQETFEHGATVPPCKTCVIILPLLLCFQEEDTCKR